MTETPGPLPPPRSRNGCLWGCLAGALIVVLVIVGASSYLGWYFYRGFKSDPTLHLVVATLNADPKARAIIGDDAQVVSLSSTSVSSATGRATTTHYVVRVRGSRGEGTLQATIVGGRDDGRITVLILTGPDGRQLDLSNPQKIRNNTIFRGTDP